ncbi:MAG: Nif3-like dinuclear metal center hexameric protein [Bacteroidetes bacterium]|nr:Nif3-like dinuclear metal center hexameric protein [Bacteroidota bacterium]
MTIKEITAYLETIAPLHLQESYDNAGLIVGDKSMEVKGILVCIDSTEDVIDEAIKHQCNLVIAHHPIVFTGLKKLNGKNYIERTVIKAVKNDVAIYAAHTNLDNIRHGVNARISERLALKNCRILSPKNDILRKLVTYAPADHADKIRAAIFAAGAGQIGNYDECSFNSEGTGTFRAGKDANPFVGEKGKQHHEKETRIETVYEIQYETAIVKALLDSHPYEEVAYDLYPLANSNPFIGSGMIGDLETSMDESDFLSLLKSAMKTECIRHTVLTGRKISKVAVCGGSGSFLLNDAIRQGAQVLVTSDFKYHQFFDADGRIVIADIGHYESEQFTKELIHSFLVEKFSTFAVRLSEVGTNPVKYF